MHEVKDLKSPLAPSQVTSESTATILRELVTHLRENRTQLRQEWAHRITEAKLLTAMSADEIFTEATAVYDQYVEALETGTFEALQPTPATCPNVLFRGGWKLMRSSASCCSCATC